MSEFNLSEKIETARNCSKGKDEYSDEFSKIKIGDVKEFIKRLKEESNNEFKEMPPFFGKRIEESLKIIIDKLAGEKLI